MENQIVKTKEIFSTETYELMKVTPPAELERRALKVNWIAQACVQAEEAKGLDLIRTINLARGRKEILAIIENTSELKKAILESADSTTGFLTDKDPSKINKKTGHPNTPYPEHTLLQCAVDALLQGVSLHNNEFNILMERAYITKNGFRHKLRDLEGVTDLQINLTPATKGTGNIKFHGKAVWKKDGVPCSLGVDQTHEICVIVRDYDSPDFALGKAERKFYKAIFETITGTSVSDGEVGDLVEPPSTKVINPKSSANETFQASASVPADEQKKSKKKKAEEPNLATPIVAVGVAVSSFLDQALNLPEIQKLSYGALALARSMIARAKEGTEIYEKNYGLKSEVPLDDIIFDVAEGDEEVTALKNLNTKILEILGGQNVG